MLRSDTEGADVRLTEPGQSRDDNLVYQRNDGVIIVPPSKVPPPEAKGRTKEGGAPLKLSGLRYEI